MSDSLWARRVAEVQADRLKAHEEYVRRVASAQAWLDHRLGVLASRAEELMGREEDLAVLVRKTPGPTVTTYHSAAKPCGRVTGVSRSRSSYRELLESEAVARRLKRCSACLWTRAIAS